MTINNNPNALPSVAVVIYRFLQSRNSPIATEELRRSIAPASVIGAEEGDEPSLQLKSTLSLLSTFGAITSDESGHRLSDELGQHKQDQASAGLLARFLREQFLAPTNNGSDAEDLWDSDKGARDFTRGAAWFLMQDIWQGPTKYEGTSGIQQEQNRQLPTTAGRKQPLFSTAIRWDAFARWAVFTGIARRDTTGVMPDATAAIVDVLDEVVPPGDYPAHILLAEIASRLPVIDGGRYFQNVEQLLTAPVPHQRDNTVTPAVTHSLLRLRDSGRLTLENRADAPDKLTLASPAAVQRREVFSHVVVKP